MKISHGTEIEDASAKFDVEEMRDLLAPDPAERRAAMRAAASG